MAPVFESQTLDTALKFNVKVVVLVLHQKTYEAVSGWFYTAAGATGGMKHQQPEIYWKSPHTFTLFHSLDSTEFMANCHF